MLYSRGNSGYAGKLDISCLVWPIYKLYILAALGG